MSEDQQHTQIQGGGRFRIRNPITKFAEVFKKQADQQWLIAKALFLHLVIQTTNITFIFLTSQSLQIRMQFEELESVLYWPFLIHIVTWIALPYLRAKHFSIPTLVGYLLLNLFVMTSLFLQSSIVVNNGLASIMTFAILAFSDYFFGFTYVFLNDYIYPSGYFGFTAFPKLFVALACYFFYDDRLEKIIIMSAWGLLQNLILGIVAEELLLDCYNEEINEFGVVDYYILMFLDVRYIVRKFISGGKVMVKEAFDKVTKVRVKKVRLQENEHEQQELKDGKPKQE